MLDIVRKQERKNPTGRDPAARVDDLLRQLGITAPKPVKITKPMSFWLPPEA
jgi:hypothetical protein